MVDMPMISVLFTQDGEPAPAHTCAVLSCFLRAERQDYTQANTVSSLKPPVIPTSQVCKVSSDGLSIRNTTPCLLVLQAPFPGSSALPLFIFSNLSGVVTASSFVFVPVEVTAAYSQDRF